MSDYALCLAENIALIREKCYKPIPPTQNEVTDAREEANRTLSFKDELDIVNCLSYLATYSDNPGQVLALCIEEKPNSGGLVISIAINNEDASTLEKGLKGIVGVLQKQASDKKSNYLDSLLHVVAQHGRTRLIKRLGHPHFTTASRLAEILAYASRRRLGSKTARQAFNALSNELTQLSNRVKATRASGQVDESSLMGILDVTASIWKDHRRLLENIINRVLSTEMDPSTKEVLYYRLRQLAQYKLTAMKLLRYARRLCVFRSIQVQTIHTGAVDLQPVLENPPAPSTGLLNRYIHGHKQTRSDSITSAMNSLGVYYNLASLQHILRQRIVQNTKNRKYKAHAEIQLLLHYETRKVAHPPRILKSNKDACYMCHLFIQTHGRWFTPKTHGRVYELWMLPDVNAVQVGMNKAAQDEWVRVVARFNEEVEKVVMQVAQGKGDKGSDNPRESAVFSLASTNTTAPASILSGSNSDRTVPASVVSGSHSDRTVTRLAARSSSSDTIRPASVWSEPEIVEDDQESAQDVLASPITPISPYQVNFEKEEDQEGSVSSTNTRPEQEANRDRRSVSPPPHHRHAFPILDLHPGLAQVYTFDNEHKGVHFHTRNIHLELTRSEAEFMAARPVSKRRVAELHIHVAWLDHQRADQILREYRGAVVDLRAHWTRLAPEEGILLSTSGLIIQNGDDVVQIKARVDWDEVARGS